VKVIIEAALLSDEEKREACRIAIDAGASFVKTSTGFGPPGANIHDVKIMRETVGNHFGVKASAGIRTAKDAVNLIKAGATRIGASAGVKIIEKFRAGDF
jgi:deoxyribose-phosphate aldolase